MVSDSQNLSIQLNKRTDAFSFKYVDLCVWCKSTSYFFILVLLIILIIYLNVDSVYWGKHNST